MPDSTIYVRATRALIHRTLTRIPQESRAGGWAANAMMTRCGLALLGHIRRAFVVKARGGTDEAGDKWQPLSPKTIAYSKTRQRGEGGRTRTEKRRDTYPSQALNARQRERWFDLYRQGLAMYKGDKSHAAARAWFISKREGATTLLQKYGGRQVEILRDTGLLLNSLSPGTNSPEQIFRVEPGTIIVGTNRKGAIFHHTGTRKMPQRRLWPDPRRWPASWWLDIAEQAKAGLVDVTLQLLRGLQ